ncbi:MAG TPA: methionyl-tRNA formyltransferase [Patescibacteria group bacterium]|nr:methionyl-tRNA formyltransferase [Patescibacteria group bacterium]
MKPRIVFFGTPDFVLPIANALKDNFEVVAVVTAPDSIDSRKKTSLPSPVKQFALKHAIPAFSFEQFDNGAIQQLQTFNPDLFVTAAYGKIIPPEILILPKFGSLNIHPSLLPKYRGTSPIQSALLDGGKTTGVTIMQMDTKMDHGPLLAQWKYTIPPHATFAQLHQILFQQATNKLPQTITAFLKGEIKPEPQNDKEATYCHKIKKEDGYFDSSNPPTPETLDRMIRAYYPWPTAWTRVKLKTGEEKILKLLPEAKVQLEGGKMMTIKDALNGYPELTQLFEELMGTQKK